MNKEEPSLLAIGLTTIAERLRLATQRISDKSIHDNMLHIKPSLEMALRRLKTKEQT